MGVIIGAGKPFRFIDHENYRFGGFGLDSFRSDFNYIFVWIHPYSQCGILSINSYLPLFDQFFTAPARADTCVGEELLQLGERGVGRCRFG